MNVSTEVPVINIVGGRVALGPAHRRQSPTYARWFNDFYTTRTQGPEPAPRTVEDRTAWIGFETNGSADRTFFSAYDRTTWQHIGFAVLRRIDHRHGTATMAMMVGEPSFRGRGYGTEISHMILDFGFFALGLHNIMLGCFEFNLARRAYEKVGFREFGRWREAYVMGGKRWDFIFMDCLATEFKRPPMTTIVSPVEPKGAE